MVDLFDDGHELPIPDDGADQWTEEEVPLSDPQGRQANFNGKAFETIVRRHLLDRGYAELKTLPSLNISPFFIYQWRSGYPSVYGPAMVIDFYVWHPTKYPHGCLVECKYQDRPGSVEQKLHYTVHCLRGIGLPAMLTVIGNGASVSARQWCKSQENHTLQVITSMDEWMSRCNRGLF